MEKMIDFLDLSAKVRISEHNTKRKTFFSFLLSSVSTLHEVNGTNK